MQGQDKAYLIMGLVGAVIIIGYFGIAVNPAFHGNSEIRVLDYTNNGTGSIPPNDPTPIINPIRPDYNEDRLAHLIFDKVNDVRIQNGVLALVWNDAIAYSAKTHSVDMNANNYFAHEDLNGVGPDQRGINAGFEMCGDVQTIQLMSNYKTHQQAFGQHQAEVNKQITILNQKAVKHNQVVDNYNKQQFYSNSFSPKDQLTTNKMYNEYQTLVKDSNELQTESNKYNQMNLDLDNEHKALENEYAEIDTTKINSGFAENLATVYSNNEAEELIADRTVNGWFNSPLHQKNMLSPNWHQSGMGISIDPDTDKILATQNFC